MVKKWSVPRIIVFFYVFPERPPKSLRHSCIQFLRGSFQDRRVAVEGEAGGSGDFHGKNLADVAGGAFEDNNLVRAGAARESLGIVAACALAEDFDFGAEERVEFSGDMAIHNLEQILVPRVFYFLRDLSLHRGCGGVLAGRISKDKGIVERDGFAEGAGFFVVLVGLAGEADDDIAGDRHAGTGGADALGEPLEFFGGITSTHDFEDAVRAALEREVDMLDELGQARKGLDQIVAVADRMGRGETHTLDAIDRADSLEQLNEWAFSIDLGKFVASVEIHDLA